MVRRLPRGRGGQTLLRLSDRQLFLETLAQTGNVTKSAEITGFAPSAFYHHRKVDPDFEEAWLAAADMASDSLEAEARRRAVEGWDEPVYQQGIQVGTVRKYSDGLLRFLLEGNKPKKFRARNSLELTGLDGGPQQVVHRVDLRDLSEAELLVLQRVLADQRDQAKAKG